MLSFASGISYLRQEALASGFILESDSDDVLVERLSQLTRKAGPKQAAKADEMTQLGQKGKQVEPGSDKKSEGKT